MLWAVVLAVLAAGGALLLAVEQFRWTAATLIPRIDEPGPRPDYQMPFPCGQEWRISTYAGHNPDDRKLDMYRIGGDTAGATVVASAPGRVERLVEPGGVKIYHGGRWYSLYLHMEDISVRTGQPVEAGDEIGRVGSVGTSAAHLHYEQLFDEDGNGRTPRSEIMPPVVQGTEYALQPGMAEWPVVTSRNACG